MTKRNQRPAPAADGGASLDGSDARDAAPPAQPPDAGAKPARAQAARGGCAMAGAGRRTVLGLVGLFGVAALIIAWLRDAWRR